MTPVAVDVCKDFKAAGGCKFYTARATSKAKDPAAYSAVVHAAESYGLRMEKCGRDAFGAAAGAAHWASFVARSGESMCTERNYLWALFQFNKAALKYCKLTLNPLRHIWVAW